MALKIISFSTHVMWLILYLALCLQALYDILRLADRNRLLIFGAYRGGKERARCPQHDSLLDIK